MHASTTLSRPSATPTGLAGPGLGELEEGWKGRGVGRAAMHANRSLSFSRWPLVSHLLPPTHTARRPSAARRVSTLTVRASGEDKVGKKREREGAGRTRGGKASKREFPRLGGSVS